MSVTTRERILEMISQSRAITVAELSQRLHTTVANIRYHLQPMIEEGIVVVIDPDARNPSRGRPAARYQLNRKRMPDDLGRLSADLLSLLLDPTQPEVELAGAMRKLAVRRSNSANITGVPTQRLNLAVDYLNQHAFQARWEAHRAGPEIRFANCPFSTIVAEHPNLCEVDRMMLENLLGAQVRVLDCFDPEKGIPVPCIFALQFTQ